MLTVGSNDSQLERAVGYNGPNKNGGRGGQIMVADALFQWPLPWIYIYFKIDEDLDILMEIFILWNYSHFHFK